MKKLVKLNRNRFFLFNSIFIINSLWFWRHVNLSGKGFLPGDDGDARFTTVLYEHWYQFLTGHTGLSQTLFFYPTQDTLVFSDSFFLQGIVHSVFRFMGLGVVNAWLIATVVLQLFSAYSAVVIAYKLKLRALPGAILVIYWGYNSTMWAQSTHVQHVMYPFIGWILLAGYGLVHAQTNKRRVAYLTIVLNLLLVLALSSTHAFIFSLLYGLLGLLMYLVLRTKRNQLRGSISKANAISFLKTACIPIILSLPLVLVFLKIYIFDTTYRTVRGLAAVSFYSPTFTDIFNPPFDNLLFGGILQKLFSHGLPGTGELGMGFTPTFLLLLLITCAFVLRNLFKINRTVVILPITLLLLVSIVELLILKDARGFSFWFLTFEQLPGFSSIRALSRVHTFQYMAASLVIALALNKYLDHFGSGIKIGKKSLHQALLKLLLPIVIIGLIVSESTPNIGRWTAQDMHFVKIAKKSQADFKKCKSFSVVPSDAQIQQRYMFAWLIDAQVLSMEYSKPTLQGYSGGEPTDYGIDISSTSQVLELSIKKAVESKNLKDSCLLLPVQAEKIKTKWRVVPIIG
jgi:hypothetical protein